MMFHFDLVWPSVSFIVQGAAITMKYASISVFFGFLGGMFLALLKLSRWSLLRIAANFYTSIFRGTPLILQLALVYYVIPQLTGWQISAFVAGVVAFSLNSTAYISEIIRAGVTSIDAGQRAACLALNIPEKNTMTDIILPQALRKILPSLVNEMIDLLKESALVSTLGEADLLRRAQLVGAEKYIYIEALLVAGFCYYVMVLMLSGCARILEKRWTS